MYQNLKGRPSQKYEPHSFVFQKVPIWQRHLANQLGGFESNFRCLKQFFRKVRRKLQSAFFLKLRFFKIRLLVTWLKYLLWAYFTYLARFSYVPYLRALNILKMDLQSIKISNFQRTIKGNKNCAVFRRSKKQLWKFLR